MARSLKMWPQGTSAEKGTVSLRRSVTGQVTAAELAGEPAGRYTRNTSLHLLGVSKDWSWSQPCSKGSCPDEGRRNHDDYLRLVYHLAAFYLP